MPAHLLLDLALLLTLSTAQWATVFAILQPGPADDPERQLDRLAAISRLGPVVGIIGTSIGLAISFTAGLDPAAVGRQLGLALAVTTAGVGILLIGSVLHLWLEHRLLGPAIPSPVGGAGPAMPSAPPGQQPAVGPTAVATPGQS